MKRSQGICLGEGQKKGSTKKALINPRLDQGGGVCSYALANSHVTLGRSGETESVKKKRNGNKNKIGTRPAVSLAPKKKTDFRLRDHRKMYHASIGGEENSTPFNTQEGRKHKKTKAEHPFVINKRTRHAPQTQLSHKKHQRGSLGKGALGRTLPNGLGLRPDLSHQRRVRGGGPELGTGSMKKSAKKKKRWGSARQWRSRPAFWLAGWGSYDQNGKF